MKEIKVEDGREKEKEIIVRHEIVSSNWKRWNHDNFSCDWNKNYSVQEREINPILIGNNHPVIPAASSRAF